MFDWPFKWLLDSSSKYGFYEKHNYQFFSKNPENYHMYII